MNVTQRENPEWGAAPRRARGEPEHTVRRYREWLGGARFESRDREGPPQRRTPAARIRDANVFTGRPTRAANYLVARHMVATLAVTVLVTIDEEGWREPLE
jgi:hypothetical protein